MRRLIPIGALFLSSVILSAQGRIESPPSAPVAYRVPVLKWDQAAGSLAEVQTYRASVFVDGVVWQEFPAWICGAPTGQTPPTLFSCQVSLAGLVPSGQAITVTVWVPAMALPSGVRIVTP